MLAVQLLDVPALLADFTASAPVLNLTMRLDHRGMLSTASATLSSNSSTQSSGGLAGALAGLFGKKETKENGTEEAAEEVTTGKAESAKIAIKFREKQLGVRGMTGEEKRMTMAR